MNTVCGGMVLKGFPNFIAPLRYHTAYARCSSRFRVSAYRQSRRRGEARTKYRSSNPARYSCCVVINAVGERGCACASSLGISPDVECRRHCRLVFRVFVFFQSHPGLGVTHCGRLCRLNIVPRPTHCNAIGAYLGRIYTQVWVIGFIPSFEVLHWPRYG